MPFLLFIAILLLAPVPRKYVDEPSLHARIVEAAKTMLTTRYPDEVHRLEIRLVRTGGQLDANSGVRLNLPVSAAVPRAHLQAKVQQQKDGEWKEMGWATLYVSHFDSVGVTTRKIGKDEQVSLGDFRFARIETTRFRGEPLRPADMRFLQEKGNIFAHKYLSEERALRMNDLRNALDVTLGQSVIMTYKRNQFVLEFTCKARRQGFTGEEIKLFAPATNKTYRARITAPGKAEWLETLK